MMRADPLHIRCPTCRAAAGSGCHAPHDPGVPRGLHKDRVAKATLGA
ncbi:MAG: hypothetical protein LC624_04265 [Halobacteriales archaeon]|nr:hypothetical protein [Halobacteriales archaeon]